MNPWITAVLTAAVLSPLLALGLGCNAEDPASWRERAALMGRSLALPPWRHRDGGNA